MTENGEPEPGEPEEGPTKIEENKEVWIVPIGFSGMIGEPSEGDSIITADSLNIVLDSSIGTDTQEGHLRFDQIVLAKEIVQDYNGIKVYKPASELQKILDHGENRHITDEHPKTGVVTSTGDRKGFIENLTFSDANELKADIVVTCSALGDAIRNGAKREVSIGFYSVTDSTPGIFNDAEYTEVQRRILLDHVAFTKNGRCSRKDGCGLKSDTKPKKVSSGVAPPLTKAQNDSIKQADAILAKQRIDTIAQISTIKPEISRETLDSMSHAELTRMHDILKSDIGVPGFKPVNTDSARKQTDAAYAKIGGED